MTAAIFLVGSGTVYAALLVLMFGAPAMLLENRARTHGYKWRARWFALLALLSWAGFFAGLWLMRKGYWLPKPGKVG